MYVMASFNFFVYVARMHHLLPVTYVTVTVAVTVTVTVTVTIAVTSHCLCTRYSYLQAR